MDDRRQHHRHQPTSPLELFERHTGLYLGRIADISHDGFMLCSATPQLADALVECQLVCSSALAEVDEFHFTADCLWSRSGETGQQSWAGYRIIDIDPTSAAALNALLHHLQVMS